MGALDFVFGILVLILIFFIGIGTIGTIMNKYDYDKLEKENYKLRAELELAKKSKTRRTNKKKEEK